EVALAAAEALLADQTRILGPDHPHTLATRNNITYWQAESGAIADALAAFEALVADHTRILGPDHPHTLATRKNIAYLQKKVSSARHTKISTDLQIEWSTTW
ncbi:tetratricopeptide repeat protein, partial [Marichromatium sp. AB32]|uniref:tetratricopeptide repeat protein n=1 Tax=Marichromatium sp. AB32 TaxID=2483363 RepID=UPI000F4050C0